MFNGKNFVLLLSQILLIILGFTPESDANTMYYGGIPVPGRRVPAIRQFELFINSCRSSPSLEKISQLIRSVNADKIAEKLQRNLYFAVDDLDFEALMGKWHTMIYEPSAQSDYCVVTYFSPLDLNGNFGEFSVLQYSLRANDGAVRLSHGSGRKYGPDPQSLLISTGQQLEPCPYFPVKAGPIRQGKYAYLVLTQALKQPTLVLARNPDEFDAFHRAEVEEYLTRFGFWRNPLTGGQLQTADWQKCEKESPFYMELEEHNSGIL